MGGTQVGTGQRWKEQRINDRQKKLREKPLVPRFDDEDALPVTRTQSV